MMWLKCCPKCSGDLYEDQDVYGTYIACIQCGHYLTVSEEVNVWDSLQSATVFGTRSVKPVRPVPLAAHAVTAAISVA